jgi:hypothetical protein
MLLDNLILNLAENIGLWRRLVARSLGVGEVGGSNPLSPKYFRVLEALIFLESNVADKTIESYYTLAKKQTI